MPGAAPPPDHVCWAHEPWFAWDLWNEVPGAPDVFDLMLNGGPVLAPHSVSVANSFEECITIEDAPGLLWLDPAIEDYAPRQFDRYVSTSDYCGLWLVHSTTGNSFEEYDDYDSPLAGTRQPQGRIEAYTHAGWTTFLRPWEVLPVLGVHTDDIYDYDDTHMWLGSMIDSGSWDAVVNSAEDLRQMRDDYQRKVNRLRGDWYSVLRGLTPRHECAARQTLEIVNTWEEM